MRCPTVEFGMSTDAGTDTRALEPREVAALLRSLGSAIVAEVEALPDEVAGWHPAPGEWCARECLGHTLEAERRGFNGRIRQILTQPEPRLAGWDQRAVQRERHDCDRPTRDLALEFQRMRADSVALVEGLGVSDLSRAGTHEIVGRVTVRDVMHEWLHHDRNHFRQIQANIQAFVWPTMGNCQRFLGD
jgi:hypothetical protein